MVDKISKDENEIVDFDRNNDQKDNDPFIRDVARQQNEGENDNRLSSYFVKDSENNQNSPQYHSDSNDKKDLRENHFSEDSEDRHFYSRENFDKFTVQNDPELNYLDNAKVNLTNSQFEKTIQSSGRATGEINIDERSDGSADINDYQTIDVESRDGFFSRSRSTDKINNGEDEEPKNTQSNDEENNKSEDIIDQYPEENIEQEDNEDNKPSENAQSPDTNNIHLPEENSEPLAEENNIAPISADNLAGIAEDGSYSFSLSDFIFNDEDGDSFDHITIVELPENGILTLNGEAVSTGDNIFTDEIDGLVFTPTENASGENYGNFKFSVSDGENSSIEHVFTIDVNAVADTPNLNIGNVGSDGFLTDFQSANFSGTWGRIDTNDIDWQTDNFSGKVEVGFETTYGGSDGSNKVIELEADSGDVTNIYKDIPTEIGEVFELSFDFSPRAGHGGEDSAIEVYWDGTLIDTIIPGNNFGWETHTYKLLAEDETARLEFKATDSNSYGGLLDNIQLNHSGYIEGSYVKLNIDAALTDVDGSETLILEISDIPNGAILNDGSGNMFTASEEESSINIANWDIDGLTIKLPSGVDAFDLKITSMAQENSNGDTSSNIQTLSINVENAPTSSNNDIIINEDEPYTFSLSDFMFNDIDDDILDHITITELPENGSLTLNGELVSAGDDISVDEIDGLVFTPEANASGEDYGDFKFTVSDGQSNSTEQNFNIDVSAVADEASLKLTAEIQGEDGLFDISSGGEVTIDVSYFSVDAGYNSSHGFYVADSDGNPIAGVVIEDNVKDLSDNTVTFNTDDYPGGVTLGFFIIPDGNTQNAGLVGGDEVTFEQIDGVWTPMLNGVALEGKQAAPAYFSNTALNPDGFDHMQDSSTHGNQNWEDLYNGGDQDFTDVNTQVTVTITQSTDVAVHGEAGTAIDLPEIISSLSDNDGSESLSIAISAIPDGVVLSDNNGHTFTASEGNGSVDITHWNLDGLSVQAPVGTDDFVLQISSTSTENSNSDSQTTTASISIDIDGQIIQALDGAEIVQGANGNDTLIYNADSVWSGYSAHNVETGENVSLAGYNRSTDVFDGGDGYDTLEGTDGNDALFLDDSLSSFNSGSQARIQNIEEINLGDGNDILDMTSSKYNYDQGITVNGGEGNDIIWTSTGDDVIDGGAGNDAIFGGDGSDTLMFMANMGHDVVDGGSGSSWMDTIELSGFNGLDQGDGWTLILNDGSSIQANDNEHGIMLLSEDAAGTITFDDGGTVTFENIEKITW